MSQLLDRPPGDAHDALEQMWSRRENHDKVEALDALVTSVRSWRGRSGSQPSSTSAIEGLLRVVRDRLDADVVFIRAWEGTRSSYRWIAGEHPERLLEFERVLGERAGSSPAPAFFMVRRADAGSYISVPIEFADGDVYGTLCAITYSRPEKASDDDIGFLRSVSWLVAEHLQDGHLAEKELELARGQLDALLNRGGLTMVMQPIADLTHDTVVGYEALARIDLDGMKPANVWFDEAGALGMGEAVEMIAVRSALAQLPALPRGAFLSVNVSAAVATSATFASALDGVAGPAVVIEMTEHERVEDYEMLEAALVPLRRRGVRVAIDDCGAGFANLIHLLRMKPDIIKLDLAITRGIDSDPVRRALATSLVGFAMETGAVLIAEGIEQPEELAAVRSLGVAWGQGHLIGRPAPASELIGSGG